jgi:hypothetical protein
MSTAINAVAARIARIEKRMFIYPQSNCARYAFFHS